MKLTKKLLSLILCGLIILGCGVSVYADTEKAPAEITGENAVGYIDQAVALIMSRYRFDVDMEDLYRAALKKIITDNPELMEDAFRGMFDSLDENSVYYSPEELDSFYNNFSGEICGIGVLITTINEGLIISNVYDNTPAMEAGLAQGDIITHADGVALGGMDIELAKQYIVGAENTPVDITFLRNGEYYTKTLVRRKVTVESGFYQIVEDGKIGYIQLTEFNDTAAEFVQKALAEFDKNNITDIIFDLRNNPGGGLYELVDICSLFIPTGPAIHLEYKNPLNSITLTAENKDKTPKYNLAVLINEYSASASEAFSGAVQDTGVGIVIGNKSFGKGTMQNVVSFKIGGGVKITEAVYLTPNGRSVHKTGITPDVKVIDKITEYERAKLEPMTYERVLKIGDEGKDVLAIEERLRILGYTVGIPDGIYDMQTYLAVLSFQRNASLYPYGIMDYTTQAKLNNTLNGKEVKNDMSYKKAVEIFTAGDWKEYKQDWSNK